VGADKTDYTNKMKLTYETAVATMIQFIVLTLLAIPNNITSIVSTCHHSGGDCVSNSIVSLIFFLLTAAWFAILWIIGFFAQERRTKPLAYLLIGGEGLTLLVTVFNVKHRTDNLGLVTSLLDFMLSAWIIWLAFRLSRSKGGRITASSRARKRHVSKVKTDL
jgi:hypothetical protein